MLCREPASPKRKITWSRSGSHHLVSVVTAPALVTSVTGMLLLEQAVGASCGYMYHLEYRAGYVVQVLHLP